MQEELTNVQNTETAAIAQEKTFTQADVDALIQKRLDRERKKYPSEDELSAYRTWKESQQTEQERWNTLTKERDESLTALSAAQAELEQLKREKYVLSKGLSGDEAEFIAYKAAKIVDDNTTFEQAVDSLTAQRHKTATFDWTASVGGGNSGTMSTTNKTMNSIIREALK